MSACDEYVKAMADLKMPDQPKGEIGSSVVATVQADGSCMIRNNDTGTCVCLPKDQAAQLRDWMVATY